MKFEDLRSLVNISAFLMRWHWYSSPARDELRPPGMSYLYVPLEPPSSDRASIRIT